MTILDIPAGFLIVWGAAATGFFMSMVRYWYENDVPVWRWLVTVVAFMVFNAIMNGIAMQGWGS